MTAVNIRKNPSEKLQASDKLKDFVRAILQDANTFIVMDNMQLN